MTRPADYQRERGERQEQRILAALKDGPMSTEQLVAHLFMSRAAVGKYIRRLIAHPRQVRIYKYEAKSVRGGEKAPYFGLGDGQHARKPKPLTLSEKFKQLKADPERHERVLAKRRIAVRLKRAAKTPNTWLSILGAP